MTAVVAAKGDGCSGLAGSAGLGWKALGAESVAGCAANKPLAGFVVSGCFKNPVSAGLGWLRLILIGGTEVEGAAVEAGWAGAEPNIVGADVAGVVVAGAGAEAVGAEVMVVGAPENKLGAAVVAGAGAGADYPKALAGLVSVVGAPNPIVGGFESAPNNP